MMSVPSASVSAWSVRVCYSDLSHTAECVAVFPPDLPVINPREASQKG